MYSRLFLRSYFRIFLLRGIIFLTIFPGLLLPGFFQQFFFRIVFCDTLQNCLKFLEKYRNQSWWNPARNFVIKHWRTNGRNFRSNQEEKWNNSQKNVWELSLVRIIERTYRSNNGRNPTRNFKRIAGKCFERNPWRNFSTSPAKIPGETIQKLSQSTLYEKFLTKL